jgi:hypothetical protein
MIAMDAVQYFLPFPDSPFHQEIRLPLSPGAWHPADGPARFFFHDVSFLSSLLGLLIPRDQKR